MREAKTHNEFDTFAEFLQETACATRHIGHVTRMREAKTHREFDTFAEFDRETAGAT